MFEQKHFTTHEETAGEDIGVLAEFFGKDPLYPAGSEIVRRAAEAKDSRRKTAAQALRSLTAAAMLLSTMPSFAAEKPEMLTETTTRKTEQLNKRAETITYALQFLKKLLEVPDQPAFNHRENLMLKQRIIPPSVEAFARTLKENPEDPKIFMDDMRRALVLLDQASRIYADEILGNNDGVLDREELKLFTKLMRTNTNLAALKTLMVKHGINLQRAV